MMARKTQDAKKILEHLTDEDSELREMIAEETLNARVARMIYEARTRAGMTQAQLAALIDTNDANDDRGAVVWTGIASRQLNEARPCLRCIFATLDRTRSDRASVAPHPIARQNEPVTGR